MWRPCGGEAMERYDGDAGIHAARGFAEAHDPDLHHALQVTRNSLALFDWTLDLHGFGDQERRLLCAAALMHDTGYETRPEQHHKGSRDLIAASRLDGFAPEELMMTACIARYHRKAEPKTAHKVFCDLDAAAQAVVERLAAILRVADGLDRSHVASAEALRVMRRGATLRLYVKQRQRNEFDVYGAMRKRALFERVFGVHLKVIAE